MSASAGPEGSMAMDDSLRVRRMSVDCDTHRSNRLVGM
ncbi:hypothetical protein BQ8420_26085 [Nocardiopsis sp. JB363]|nr:hypothetical protein BQ8420_26085 [Nocardiopsis sp. JB363]